MTPKITIITVCFNSEETIKRTIESVLNQSYKDYEYLIIDGGSKDKTISIIESYKEKFGDRLHYISETDYGIYDAMNKGILKADGELIGILNSDDYYETDALENIYKIYEQEKNNIDNKLNSHFVIYGAMRVLMQGKEMAVELLRHEFLEMQMIDHPSCFVTKSVYEDYGMFDLQYKSAADFEFMLRLFYKSDTKFVPVYKIITNFERGGSSSNPNGGLETAVIRYNYGLIPKSRLLYEKLHASLVKVNRKLKKR